ncbi:MAG: translation initiation factor IF-2 [Spirochaetota bacterium]|nr:translation initiation factor IF-2 [Spirochaetota bacterium]
MKAVDIATKNRVSLEHVMIICKELGISCENDDSDLSEKDVFLVEKKIEVLKEERASKTLELLAKKGVKAGEKGKKIKLKRKVQRSKGLIKDKPAEPSPELPTKSQQLDESREVVRETSEKNLKDNKINQQVVVEKREPTKGKTFEEKGKDKESKGKDKESVVAPTKDESQKKRKKGKEKDKDKNYKKKYYKDEEVEKDLHYRKKKDEVIPVSVIPKCIEITESITVGDLSKKLNIKAKEVITKLMKMGVMATINQVVDVETAEILASEYDTEVRVVSLFEETLIKTKEVDREEDRTLRPPIVTVMGHVDHGKTRLLDTIRKTNVIDQEIGGITQHIGAYMIMEGDQYITFLDTPGHESFTTMRARGASITDIVILVVAADDGVMPQTIEAINHSKDADVPIIVAINKIDLQDANIQRVKQELSNYGLVPEEWGGNTLFAEISAKQKINIEGLLELVLIQAEMLELKANPKLMALGTVVESRIDPGRGPVATILVQEGILRVGDPFVVGVYSGKVRAMFDDQGRFIKEAGPSVPVEVIGISGVSSAGDPFQCVESEKYAKQIAQKRQELQRIENARKIRKVTLENISEMIKEGEIQELRIIVKGDVDGSVQALKESLEKFSTDEVRVKIIHAGTGGINESDVMLASASNAIVIGYHVRPTAKVADVAQREGVSIKFYNVIFEATNDIKSAMEGMLSPDYKEESVGIGGVKQIFKISKVGVVAGGVLHRGKLERNNRIRIIRDGVVVYDGELKSLKRYTDDVSGVETNQECGFSVEGFNDIKVGDSFESYRVIEIAKTMDI